MVPLKFPFHVDSNHSELKKNRNYKYRYGNFLIVNNCISFQIGNEEVREVSYRVSCHISLERIHHGCDTTNALYSCYNLMLAK